uniref:Uncharacterized protein n=1 Tax=Aegilops tauschii subsp. strangulata TaxID=200361 RepID=A0A453RHI9_AEGTS
MMRAEGKATRSANRSSPWKSSYVAYGLLLGSLLVLLYLMVSTQFSYSQKALLDPAAIDSAGTIPAKHRRSHPGQDDASRGMEEFSRDEEEEEKAKAHTEPSTPRRQEKQDESEQQWAGRNSIEEQLGAISVYYYCCCCSISNHRVIRFF